MKLTQLLFIYFPLCCAEKADQVMSVEIRHEILVTAVHQGFHMARNL